MIRRNQQVAITLNDRSPSLPTKENNSTLVNWRIVAVVESLEQDLSDAPKEDSEIESNIISGKPNTILCYVRQELFHNV